MQVYTQLENNAKISADLIVTKDENNKAIPYDDKFRFSKLCGGGNCVSGSYQTLSENPKNFDFLILTYRAATGGGASVYAWQSTVVPTELIEFNTSSTMNDTKTWQLAIYQKGAVYSTASIMFYNSGSTYRIYLKPEESKGWSDFVFQPTYGVKLK